MSFFQMSSPLAARRLFLGRTGLTLSGAAVALLAGNEALAKQAGGAGAQDVQILNTALGAELLAAVEGRPVAEGDFVTIFVPETVRGSLSGEISDPLIDVAPGLSVRASNLRGLSLGDGLAVEVAPGSWELEHGRGVVEHHRGVELGLRDREQLDDDRK